jgi:hypothetical protein
MAVSHFRRTIITSLLIVLSSLGLSGTSHADSVVTGKSGFKPEKALLDQPYVPNQILVKYKRSSFVKNSEPIADRNNYIIEQDDPDNLNGNNKAVGNIVTVSAP